MLCFLFWGFLTQKKSQFLYLFSVDFTAFHCIDSCSVYARVTEDIGKTNYILLQGVVGSREKVSKIMRKYLFLRHSCRLAEFLHIRPNIRPIEWITVLRNKDGATLYFLLADISFENLTQL